jgi:hypothetical protein
MARPLRIEYPGAFYHVTSRGNERKETFSSLLIIKKLTEGWTEEFLEIQRGKLQFIELFCSKTCLADQFAKQARTKLAVLRYG